MEASIALTKKKEAERLQPEVDRAVEDRIVAEVMSKSTVSYYENDVLKKRVKKQSFKTHITFSLPRSLAISNRGMLVSVFCTGRARSMTARHANLFFKFIVVVFIFLYISSLILPLLSLLISNEVMKSLDRSMLR